MPDAGRPEYLRWQAAGLRPSESSSGFSEDIHRLGDAQMLAASDTSDKFRGLHS